MQEIKFPIFNEVILMNRHKLLYVKSRNKKYVSPYHMKITIFIIFTEVNSQYLHWRSRDVPQRSNLLQSDYARVYNDHSENPINPLLCSKATVPLQR